MKADEDKQRVLGKHLVMACAYCLLSNSSRQVGVVWSSRVIWASCQRRGRAGADRLACLCSP